MASFCIESKNDEKKEEKQAAYGNHFPAILGHK